MKKVLIITYYWPPSGGSGVQRWLKFVKYLREFGWEPIIYTPENPEFPEMDESLAKDIPEGLEIIGTPIWEPYDLYKKFIGQKKEDKIKTGFLSEKKKNSFTEDIAVWIRGNWFIPDARKFWIKPSVHFLKKYLSENHVDAIISTGPPHSMHMIAYHLHQQIDIPWFADFRDPWTGIDFYHELKLSKWADRQHHKQEKLILENANRICVVGPTMAEDFKAICKRKYDVITNGYDEGDVPAQNEILRSDKFTLVHMGSMTRSRNPVAFWDAIKEIIQENPEMKKTLEIRLVGKVDYSVITSYESAGLSHLVNKIEYIPHQQVIGELKRASVLLLLINNSPTAKMILTGKFFEYMAAKRPILCIGPNDGDAAQILKKTAVGINADFDDKEEIKSAIIKYYANFMNGEVEISSNEIQAYSRKNLTHKLASILDEMI
ncbi:MAG: glycosyltransferase family 4 protein [Bacteroidales bacterium]|nr:glycosyltransferase family 4 protein [Bacteroidales bacterium]